MKNKRDCPHFKRYNGEDRCELISIPCYFNPKKDYHECGFWNKYLAETKLEKEVSNKID